MAEGRTSPAMRFTRLADGLHLFEGPSDAAARDAVLRPHLADAAGCDPEALVVVRDERGKPRLSQPADRLFFNVSHRSRLFLVGTSPDRPVGVDLEIVAQDAGFGPSSDSGVEAVARAFFARGEVAWLASLPEADRSLAFFRLWTAKEAVLKAAGLGIGGGLLEPDLSAALAPGLPLAWDSLVAEAGGRRYGLEWFAVSTADGEVCVARALELGD